MASITAAARPTANASSGSSKTTAGTSNTTSTSSSSTSSSSSSTTHKSASSSSAQQPQVSLLGTIPLHLVPALLRRIDSSLVTLPATALCEKETVLARHDDETSAVRETGDNAWASVVKARRGIKLRVQETLRTSKQENEGKGSVECTLSLPLLSLPERQHPKASVRPIYNVQMLSDTAISPGHSIQKQDPFAAVESAELGFDPQSFLNTDPVNGWKSFVSSIGWRPHFTFLRYGLSFSLNDILSRQSSTASPNPLNPSQGTKHTLNVFRIFTPDPTGYTDDWTPLDPQGATVVVELVVTVGGQIDQSHFNPYCSTADVGMATQTGGGMDPNSTIETAVEFAESVARCLRGLVDLKREAYD
ncbi:uncharacterized protein UTRI_04353 [Ustilago trichophora]|uniref:Uncharacterized protein n=1 Tax=Ustilago trichophora TaxID=86804 RepID=A0A5C3ET89_9BASI|nr:uncharacterized protein UTRI_04353 [Ustilago trichophora]